MAAISPVESLPPPPKRMRVGTRSCAECRRRKVRCIYAPESRVCKECALHGARCVSQAARPERHGNIQVESAKPDNNAQDMHQRIDDLESVIRALSKVVECGEKSWNGDCESIAVEAIRRLQRVSTPDRVECASTSAGKLLDSLEYEQRDTASGPADVSRDAPLLNFFREAIVLQGNDFQSARDGTGQCSKKHLTSCIKAVTALVPQMDDLSLILKITEPCWPIWRAFPENLLASSGHSRTDKVSSARNFILDSLRSGSPAIVAKAVLCLALCIQQLPRDFKYHQTHLPAPLNDLLDSYLKAAETLLSFTDDFAATMDSLECLMIQAKFFINSGKPRKAWLIYRRAISLALFLRLDHDRPENGADERRKSLWSHIWQGDRLLSLNLGLPSAIADAHPGLSIENCGQSVGARVTYELSIICGHIIERNHNHQNVDYAVTQRIAEELQQCRNGRAAPLFDTVISPSTPLGDLYNLQVAKLYYHNLCKLLHLPYMLKSSADRRYEASRIAALEAARAMIESYQTLRNGNGGALFICDLMDFQVFTAAVVLVINLLSPSRRSQQDSDQTTASDWELVRSMTRCLKHVSYAMECNVAGQAAHLLEYLSMAHDGTYSTQEPYDAVIPYFGKVRISKVRREAAASTTEAIPPHSNLESNSAGAFSNVVEFSANCFTPFSPSSAGECLSEAELGVGWAIVREMEAGYGSCAPDADNGFEWSQAFDSASFYMN